MLLRDAIWFMTGCYCVKPYAATLKQLGTKRHKESVLQSLIATVAWISSHMRLMCLRIFARHSSKYSSRR